MSLQSQRKHLIASLPPLTHILRGTLLREHHHGCPCHPKGRYGPYWRLSVNQAGRTRMRQLKPHQLARVRQAAKNYQRWRKICRRIFDLNARILLAQED